MNMFGYAVKELARRKKLYLLSIATMALVSSLIITLNSLGTAYRAASRLPFEDIQGTIVVQRNGNVPEDISGVLLSCSLAPISPGLISMIAKYDGVKGVSAPYPCGYLIQTASNVCWESTGVTGSASSWLRK